MLPCFLFLYFWNADLVKRTRKHHLISHAGNEAIPATDSCAAADVRREQRTKKSSEQ